MDCSTAGITSVSVVPSKTVLRNTDDMVGFLLLQGIANFAGHSLHLAEINLAAAQTGSADAK